MSPRAGFILIAYLTALVVGLFLQCDRLAPWLLARFDNAPPEAVRWALEQARGMHASLGLTGLGRDLECSLAPVFEGSYKNGYRCSEAALVDAGREVEPGRGAAGEQALSVRPSVAAQAVSRTDPARAGRPDIPALSAPCLVLVVGDSLATALAAPMESACRNREGFTVVARGKIASGLQNPQYYNWEEALRQFLDEFNPQLVVVMMGANDAKYLNLDPEAQPPAAVRDKRVALYEARAKRFVAAMDERGVPSCWIGLPIMGDPDLAAKSQALNALIRQVCEDSRLCRYVDVWDLLADGQGQYAHYLTNAKGGRVRVREGDRIHFSRAGGDIIVKALIEQSGALSVLRAKDMAEYRSASRTRTP